MRIDRIDLWRIRLPYRAPFETSGWREDAAHSIIVRLEAGGGAGWGEAPVDSGPWYNEELSAAAWVVMRDVLAPLLLGADLSCPEDVDTLFRRVRGNRLARAGFEFATWDLFGRLSGRSLRELLGGVHARVEVGVSVGVQPDLETLLREVERYLGAGYRRIKLKIKPGWDIAPTRAVRERWPDLRLQVDANSIYTLADAEHLAQLDALDLLLIEQPLAHDDIVDHARLQRRLRTPICLDESIVSPEHARWALELGSCRVINIKPARLGGLAAARQVHDLAAAAGVPVWCGGMMETGVGRATSVALASLPNFTLPGDTSANDRYFACDIVRNPFVLNADGTLSVPTGAGASVEVDVERLDAIAVEQVCMSARGGINESRSAHLCGC